MTAAAVPAFVSHGSETPAATSAPVDRSPEVMSRLRFPFDTAAATVPGGKADDARL